MEKLTKEQVEKMLFTIGLEYSKIIPINNRYWLGDNSVRGPWFIIMTKYGPFEVGWRKRVLVISWENCDITLTDTITENGDTQAPTEVHAWNILDWCYYFRKIVVTIREMK